MGQFSYLIGEVVLAVSALVLLLVGVFGGKRSTSLVRYGSIIALLIFAFSGYVINAKGAAFDGAFVSDSFSHYADRKSVV